MGDGLVEAVGAVVEDGEGGGGVGIAMESDVVLESKVEAFEDEIRVLAAELPLDRSVFAGDSKDGTRCSRRDQIIAIGALINCIDVAILLLVSDLQSGMKDTYK